MKVEAIKQSISAQASKIQERWNHPSVLKIRKVAFEVFSMILSTCAGLFGAVFGVGGGVVLVTIGTVLGLGSLITHVSTLFATCVVDSFSSVYNDCYDYLARFAPATPVKLASL